MGKKKRGVAPNVQPWGYMPPGTADEEQARLTAAAQAEVQRQQEQRRRVAALLGVGALAASGGGLGAGRAAGVDPAAVPKSAGARPGVRRGGGGDSPLGRGPGQVAADQAKVFPMAFMGAAGAGAGAGAGGMLANPVVGASIAAGVDLVGGLAGGAMGGGDAEELAKDQLRAERQINLFDGFREWNNRLERRNQEMRAVLAKLGSG